MNRPNEVTIDPSGRVHIPKAIRMQMGLSSGSKLAVEIEDNREIRLRLIDETSILVDKDGVLVVRSESLGKLGDVEKREREARLSTLTQRAGL